MQKQKIKHRGVLIGDMQTRIIIHDRNIRTPIFGSVDFGERFDGFEVWAAIETISGKAFFDGVGMGQELTITHKVYIRYEESVSSQTFIQTDDGRRFKILSVEDYDDRGEYMMLLCTDRGFDEAAKI